MVQCPVIRPTTSFKSDFVMDMSDLDLFSPFQLASSVEISQDSDYEVLERSGIKVASLRSQSLDLLTQIRVWPIHRQIHCQKCCSVQEPNRA